MKIKFRKANESKLKVNYVNVVKMVDNYLPGFDIKKQFM